MVTQKTFSLSLFFSLIGSLCIGAQEQSKGSFWVQVGHDIHKVATEELAKIKAQDISTRDEADRLYSQLFKPLWNQFDDAASELAIAQMDNEPTIDIEKRLENIVFNLVEAQERFLSALKAFAQQARAHMPQRPALTGWRSEIGGLAGAQHPRLGQRSAARYLPPQAVRDIAAYLQKNIKINYEGQPNVLIKITNLRTNIVVWQGWFRGMPIDDAYEPKFLSEGIVAIPLDPLRIEVSFRVAIVRVLPVSTHDLTVEQVGRLDSIRAEAGFPLHPHIDFLDDQGRRIK